MCGGGLNSLQRSSRCILLPQPTGQQSQWICNSRNGSAVAMDLPLYHNDLHLQHYSKVKLLLERNTNFHLDLQSSMVARSPHSVVGYDIIPSEFKLQPLYYLHIWINTLGKGMNPLILPAIGKIVPLLFFYKDDFGIK